MPPKKVTINPNDLKCTSDGYYDLDSTNLIMKYDSKDWIKYLDKPVKDWASKKKKNGLISYPCHEGKHYIQIDPTTLNFCCVSSEIKEQGISSEDKQKIINHIKETYGDGERSWIPITHDGEYQMWRRNTMKADKSLIEELPSLPLISVVIIVNDQLQMKNKDDIKVGDIIDLSAVNKQSKLITKYLATIDEDYTTSEKYLSEEDIDIHKNLLSQITKLSKDASKKNEVEILRLKLELKEFNEKKEKEYYELILLVKKTIFGSSKIKKNLGRNISLDEKKRRSENYTKIETLNKSISEVTKNINEKIPVLKTKMENAIIENEQIKMLITEFKENLKLELEFEKALEFYIGYLKENKKIPVSESESYMNRAAISAAETVSDLNAPPTQHIHILLTLIEEIEEELKKNIIIITQKLKEPIIRNLANKMSKKAFSTATAVTTTEGLPRNKKKSKTKKGKTKKGKSKKGKTRKGK